MALPSNLDSSWWTLITYFADNDDKLDAEEEPNDETKKMKTYGNSARWGVVKSIFITIKTYRFRNVPYLLINFFISEILWCVSD